MSVLDKVLEKFDWFGHKVGLPEFVQTPICDALDRAYHRLFEE